MKTKRCSHCGVEKPLEEFYRDRSSKDGRQIVCIVCKKIIAKKYCDSDKGKRTRLASNRRAARKPDYKEKKAAREQIYSNTEDYRKKRRKWYKQNKDKISAQKAVQYALSIGKLVKPKICSQPDKFCSGRIEAHHEDYTKKLEVVWLCSFHHSELHRIRRGWNWNANAEKHTAEPFLKNP